MAVVKLAKSAKVKKTKAERQAAKEADKAAAKLATQAAKDKMKADRANVINRFTRGIECTGVRIVLSVADDDGHAPLADYAEPYIRGPVCGPYAGNVNGFEYRPVDEAGQYIGHDYAIVMRVVPVGTDGILSWAYTPVADEITELLTIQRKANGNPKLDKDGNIQPILDANGNFQYDAPVVTAQCNLVIDAMLDALMEAGLVYSYWTSLADLEADTGADAMAVKASWPVEWVVDGVRTMLQIS
jgi:hypothetical protein